MQINTETLLQIVGQKEVELTILRQQVAQLQEELKELKRQGEES